VVAEEEAESPQPQARELHLQESVLVQVPVLQVPAMVRLQEPRPRQ
jgi:hypothetical protein